MSIAGPLFDVKVDAVKPTTEKSVRCMVIIKATKEIGTRVLPSTELLTEMGEFNEELVKARVAGPGTTSTRFER